jgi:ParB-like chromosome segregation protein Spo0J
MEFHEAANIFPLDEENIGDLAEDIRKNGQRVAIELMDGKILDGRRRWLACEKAGVKPITREVMVSDPVDYVISLNLHRRHLSASQRAMVSADGAALKKKLSDDAKVRQREASVRAGKASGASRRGEANVPVVLPERSDKGDTRDQRGKAVGVSGKLIDQADKVKEKGVPELQQAVKEGRVSVHRAAEIADEKPEVQVETIREPKPPLLRQSRTGTTTNRISDNSNPVDDLIGKLTRAINEWGKKVGKDKGHAECIEAVENVARVWRRWYLKTK